VTSVLLPLNTTPDNRVDTDFRVALFTFNAIQHSSAAKMISDSINLFDLNHQELSGDAALDMPQILNYFPYI
jgi:hypothetical protein